MRCHNSALEANPGISDTAVVNRIRLGLLPSLYARVKLLPRVPNTFKALFDFEDSICDLLPRDDPYFGDRRKTPTHSPSQLPDLRILLEKSESPTRQVMTKPDMSKMTCHRCSQKGHIAKGCKNKPKRLPGSKKAEKTKAFFRNAALGKAHVRNTHIPTQVDRADIPSSSSSSSSSPHPAAARTQVRPSSRPHGHHHHPLTYERARGFQRDSRDRTPHLLPPPRPSLPAAARRGPV